VKIGDLVKMKIDHYIEGELGIIVDGPRDDLLAVRESPAISYAVAWFDAKTTFWHLDSNLETLSEDR
jgi:hypothetical protein